MWVRIGDGASSCTMAGFTESGTEPLGTAITALVI